MKTPINMKTPIKKMERTIRIMALVLAISMGFLGPNAAAQSDLYSKMAPVDQYLMEKNAEIQLARSAAPDSISRDAMILVLGRQGYETAVKGKNGFVCIVDRSWASATDDPDFWNPKVRSPMCLNAAGARSYLPLTIKRTDLILAGRTKAQMVETIASAVDKKELPAIEPGAMCYMLSKDGYGNDTVGHWHPHLMFFYSQTDPATWGADLPGSPILAFSDAGEHLTIFAIPVQRWSDGTEDRQAEATNEKRRRNEKTNLRN